jgi:hypothetical protein
VSGNVGVIAVRVGVKAKGRCDGGDDDSNSDSWKGQVARDDCGNNYLRHFVSRTAVFELLKQLPGFRVGTCKRVHTKHKYGH